jgi:hypothetical protein
MPASLAPGCSRGNMRDRHQASALMAVIDTTV